ncbi:hypothetical protein [Candidatus Regiella endosymbiont of Tuberolachnus salignus]|uniref:hypothetical protein n=1 Tax=Candidatus Regiella endosymbiont of Tuberolachnus salignus TaxID=3077956 RepID=UPI0030D22F99
MRASTHSQQRGGFKGEGYIRHGFPANLVLECAASSENFVIAMTAISSRACLTPH